MGKSKGGGGGVQTPKIPILPSFNIMNAGAFEPLGTFGAQQTMGLGNMANWAANLATGGNAQTQGEMPYTGLLAGGENKLFAPFTTSGTTGGAGLNPFTGEGTSSGGGSFLSGLNAQQLGPFLASAVQNLLSAQGSTGILANLIPGLTSTATADTAQGNKLLGTGTNMLTQATTGSGLYPSQQALINQGVTSQQQQITQQLANEGLSNSTLGASLRGQAQMSGAAAAGQLIQSNIALAEQEQGVGMQEQQIGLDASQISIAAQQALFSQFSNIASMSSGLQSQVWSQAMQGYGEMGQMLNNTVNAFGYGLKTQEDIQSAAISQAQVEAQANATNASLAAQQAQSSASMFTGLGQLLGGQGLFSSGGIFGSNGLFSSAGGLGGLLSGAGGVGSLFGIGASGAGAAAGAGAVTGTDIVSAVITAFFG